MQITCLTHATPPGKTSPELATLTAHLKAAADAPTVYTLHCPGFDVPIKLFEGTYYSQHQQHPDGHHLPVLHPQFAGMLDLTTPAGIQQAAQLGLHLDPHDPPQVQQNQLQQVLDQHILLDQQPWKATEEHTWIIETFGSSETSRHQLWLLPVNVIPAGYLAPRLYGPDQSAEALSELQRLNGQLETRMRLTVHHPELVQFAQRREQAKKDHRKTWKLQLKHHLSHISTQDLLEVVAERGHPAAFQHMLVCLHDHEMVRCSLHDTFSSACKAAVLWLLPDLVSFMEKHPELLWIPAFSSHIENQNWVQAWTCIPTDLPLPEPWQVHITPTPDPHQDQPWQELDAVHLIRLQHLQAPHNLH